MSWSRLPLTTSETENYRSYGSTSTPVVRVPLWAGMKFIQQTSDISGGNPLAGCPRPGSPAIPHPRRHHQRSHLVIAGPVGFHGRLVADSLQVVHFSR